MRPLAASQESGSYIVVAFTIWIELACGLEATTWTAFYNNPHHDVWIYLIFGLYLTFTLVLMYLTGPEICARLKQTATKSATLNWVFVLCTPITFAIFWFLYKHNQNLELDAPTHMLDKAYHVILMVLILFPSFYMLCSFASNEQLPLLIFIIWIQLGAGLAITIPTAFIAKKKGNPHWLLLAYIVFAIDSVMALKLVYFTGQEICSHNKRNVPNLMIILYWTCRFCTLMTGLLFVAMWGYHGSLLSIQPSYAYAVAVYMYSFYFLILLELLPKKIPLVQGGEEFTVTYGSELGLELGPV